MIDIYKELDNLYSKIAYTSKAFDFSKYVIDKFIQIGYSAYYSALIIDIINKIKEDNLNNYLITKERHKFINFSENIFEDASNLGKIDKSTYKKIRKKMILEFPRISKLIKELEKSYSIKNIDEYFVHKKKLLFFKNKRDVDLESKFLTFSLEKRMADSGLNSFDFVESKNYNNYFNDFVDLNYNSYYIQNIRPLIKSNIQNEKLFNNNLKKRWNKTFKVFEDLLFISFNSVSRYRQEWIKNGTISIKQQVLIEIHARALRICNEVFTLLKSGYPDGALARWRSLHELDVISDFLKVNDEIISERYFNFQYIIQLKKAEEFNKYAERIDYESYSPEEIDTMKKNVETLKKKYGKDFRYNKGWGWIPSNMLPAINFSEVEAHVKLDHYRPYYMWSSDSIHGNSTGFYPLGIPKGERLLLIGPSNIGLTDPLHCSALSFARITANILGFKNNFESSFIIGCINKLTKVIGESAINVENSIKKDEPILNKRKSIERFNFFNLFYLHHSLYFLPYYDWHLFLGRRY